MLDVLFLVVLACGVVYLAMHVRSRRAAQALAEAKKSERRFRDLTELSADWFWETDAAHRITWISGGTPVATFFGGNPTGGNTNMTTPTAVTVKANPIAIITPNPGASATPPGVPATSNSFATSYGDPLSSGLPSKWASGPPKPFVTFGKANYTTTTSTAPSSSNTVPTTNGWNTYGVFRNPPYATVLSSEMPRVVHDTGVLQPELRSTIDRSSFITSQGTVQLKVNDGVVVLDGQVASEKEFRIIEGMMRTTPGVRGVVNELRIVPTK